MNTRSKKPSDPPAETSETLLGHLIELRDRILRMFLAILVAFLVLFPFANPIYTFMAQPLMAHLPEGSSMIAIEVAAPFLIPFKLVLLLAVALTIPYTLYQFWAFIAPGLYQHEKKLAGPLVLSSTLLFYLGMAFAYFVVFPLIFAFFTAAAPEGVAVMTDISRYLDFIITLFFAFGVAFEVPIATILLVLMGVTTPEKLAAKRPYVIVGAFVIGMVLTPPDIISQTLLALPMWILFEIGLFLSRLILRQREQNRALAGPGGVDGEDENPPTPPPPPTGPKPSGPKPSGTQPTEPVGQLASAMTARPVSRAPERQHLQAIHPAPGSSSAPMPTVPVQSVAAPVATHATTAPVSPATPSSLPTVTEEAYWPMTQEEMDAELDRIEAAQRERQAARPTATATTATTLPTNTDPVLGTEGNRTVDAKASGGSSVGSVSEPQDTLDSRGPGTPAAGLDPATGKPSASASGSASPSPSPSASASASPSPATPDLPPAPLQSQEGTASLSAVPARAPQDTTG